MSTQDHVAAMLESLGLYAKEDPEIARTPERVAALLEDLFSGLAQATPDLSLFDCDTQDPVVLLALPFKSMCVHHLLPFFGEIDIAYVPKGKAAGFGGFIRVIEHYAKRPQVQERMVEQIANRLQDILKPQGLIVRCRARQMCVEMRQRTSPASFVSTTSRGSLIDGPYRGEILGQFQVNERPL